MSKFVSIKIPRSLLNLDRNMVKAFKPALQEIGDRVENEAKKTKSFIDRTRHLRISIKRQTVNLRNLFVTVKALAEYGIFINDGTRYIRARRFMEKALKKIEPLMESVVIKHLNKKMGR